MSPKAGTRHAAGPCSVDGADRMSTVIASECRGPALRFNAAAFSAIFRKCRFFEAVNSKNANKKTGVGYALDQEACGGVHWNFLAGPRGLRECGSRRRVSPRRYMS